MGVVAFGHMGLVNWLMGLLYHGSGGGVRGIILEF